MYTCYWYQFNFKNAKQINVFDIFISHKVCLRGKNGYQLMSQSHCWAYIVRSSLGQTLYKGVCTWVIERKNSVTEITFLPNGGSMRLISESLHKAWVFRESRIPHTPHPHTHTHWENFWIRAKAEYYTPGGKTLSQIQVHSVCVNWCMSYLFQGHLDLNKIVDNYMWYYIMLRSI